MVYFSTAFILFVNLLFWGVGLVLLVAPRRYLRFALVFAPVGGLSLQSLVVWLGAYANLRGTDSYAYVASAVPLLLGIAGVARVRRNRVRLAWFGGLAALVAMQLILLVAPLAFSGRALTTMTSGSLDAADYAAGGRVLQEFAHSDRGGLLGQSEVVSVGAVDNFFDFWLRTNHFTPSALIALNGSVLGLKPHQITGLITLVFFAAALPMVFWLARLGLGFRRQSAMMIAAIYAVSPINGYAAYNIASAQILAANALALITLCAFQLWRGGRGTAKGWCALLGIGFLLTLGSYNFILIVCLVPGIAYVLLDLKTKRPLRRGAVWLVCVIVPLTLASLIYLQRALGIVERLTLFKNNFGWDISAFTPEAWFGLVEGTWLKPLSGPVRWLTGTAAFAIIAISWAGVVRRRSRQWKAVVAVSLPILFGYAVLHARHWLTGAFTSYDAYKLFAVFYPGLLASFCAGLDLLNGSRRQRVCAWGLFPLLLIVNIGANWRVPERVTHATFVVDSPLVELGAVEKNPNVTSLNLRVTDGWDRLWASAFLLRKQHYFEIHTYEGRRSTELKGDWDLVGRFFSFDLTERDQSYHPSPDFTLLLRRSPLYVEAYLEPGWLDHLRDDRAATARSQWAATSIGAFRLVNPHSYPLRVSLSGRLRAFSKRSCEIVVRGESRAVLELSNQPTEWIVPNITLPPGESTVAFRTTEPLDLLGGRQKVTVGFAADGINIKVLGPKDVLSQ